MQFSLLSQLCLSGLLHTLLIHQLDPFVYRKFPLLLLAGNILDQAFGIESHLLGFPDIIICELALALRFFPLLF